MRCAHAGLTVLLALTPAGRAQLLTVSPCNVLDPRHEALEAVTGAFDECVSSIRYARAYWREGIPKVSLQHLLLLRATVREGEVREAERIHRKAMDLFSGMLSTPVHGRAESEQAAAMIGDYLLISQRLRQLVPEDHPRFPAVEREAYATPLATLTRVMDQRTMLTTTLSQRFRTRMRRRPGEGGPGNRIDLPHRADPLEMLLAGLEERVEEYDDAGEEERARELVAACRRRVGPGGRPKKRFWIQVDRTLRKLERKL